MKTESRSRFSSSSIQLPTCSECLYSTKLCFDRIIDFVQSREGRKKIRKALVPFFLIGSLLMIVAGAIWGKVTNPICGTSYGSAQFSIHTEFSTGERIFKGNSCPGYDWTQGAGKNTLLAGQFDFKYVLSTSPKLSNQKVYVTSTLGAIGIALNGIPIYSADGYELEQYIVDDCGGSVSSVNTFVFGANNELPGYYHYRFLPGSTSYSKMNNFTFCTAATSWYNNQTILLSPSSKSSYYISSSSATTNVINNSKSNQNRMNNNNIDNIESVFQTSTLSSLSSTSSPSSTETTNSILLTATTKTISQHSSLVGWMADGIPIYGPYTTSGKLPQDLDECGGHSSDDYAFYHYHYQPNFPYSVTCLRGCLDGSMNSKLNSGKNCDVNLTYTTSTSSSGTNNNLASVIDYSYFQYYSTTYGGSTINLPDWTGPITLLAFGFAVFIPACLCCICALCSQKKRAQPYSHGHTPWWVQQGNNNNNNNNIRSSNSNIIGGGIGDNDLDIIDDDNIL